MLGNQWLVQAEALFDFGTVLAFGIVYGFFLVQLSLPGLQSSEKDRERGGQGVRDVGSVR